MTEANAGQKLYWNDAPGVKWITHQQALDRMNHSVAELVLNAAAPRTGEQVLDIGCGAGATTIMAARAVAPGGYAVGLDISGPLVRHANKRFAEEGLDNAEALQGDAQTQPAPEQGVDLALSRFGVMFFDDPVAAFVNIRRLIRPGGRLVFACWAEGNPWFDLPMQAAVAQLGPAEPKPADAPGPLAFRDPARVRDILEGAHFTGVQIDTHEVPLVIPEGLEAGLEFCKHLGPISRHMTDKNGTEADFDAIMDRLRPAFAAFDTDQGLMIPGRVHLVQARA